MTITYTTKTLTTEGKMYREGYLVMTDVTVTDWGDTITVNTTEHLKEDLVLEDREIRSRWADWEVCW